MPGAIGSHAAISTPDSVPGCESRRLGVEWSGGWGGGVGLPTDDDSNGGAGLHIPCGVCFKNERGMGGRGCLDCGRTGANERKQTREERMDCHFGDWNGGEQRHANSKDDKRKQATSNERTRPDAVFLFFESSAHSHSSINQSIDPTDGRNHPVYRFATDGGGRVFMMSGRRRRCDAMVVLRSAKNVSSRKEAWASGPCFAAASTQCRRYTGQGRMSSPHPCQTDETPCGPYLLAMYPAPQRASTASSVVARHMRPCGVGVWMDARASAWWDRHRHAQPSKAIDPNPYTYANLQHARADARTDLALGPRLPQLGILRKAKAKFLLPLQIVLQIEIRNIEKGADEAHDGIVHGLDGEGGHLFSLGAGAGGRASVESFVVDWVGQASEWSASCLCMPFTTIHSSAASQPGLAFNCPCYHPRSRSGGSRTPRVSRPFRMLRRVQATYVLILGSRSCPRLEASAAEPRQPPDSSIPAWPVECRSKSIEIASVSRSIEWKGEEGVCWQPPSVVPS